MHFLGDFFKDDLPEAELYVLSHVLHDWSDECIDQLLSKIYRTLKPGEYIVMCTGVLNMKTGVTNSYRTALGQHPQNTLKLC